MKLLLDTHALLWFFDGDPKLSRTAREHIENAGNNTCVSIASLWEIAIKTSVGRLQMLKPIEDLFGKEMERNGFALLAVLTDHVLRVASLPLYHKDPFDRMIVAQSLVEQMEVVSADTAFDRYSVVRVW